MSLITRITATYLPRKGFTKLDYYKGYEQIIGTNYSNKIPTMNNPDYQGLDRTNERFTIIW